MTAERNHVTPRFSRSQAAATGKRPKASEQVRRVVIDRTSAPPQRSAMMRSLFFGLLLLSAFPAGAEVSFDYDQTKPLDLQDTGSREQDGVRSRDITYALPDGSRNAATMIARDGREKSRPGVVFVHWYGTPAPTSNRTQFIPDAIELAKSGTVSLLIGTHGRVGNIFVSRWRLLDTIRRDVRRACGGERSAREVFRFRGGDAVGLATGSYTDRNRRKKRSRILSRKWRRSIR